MKQTSITKMAIVAILCLMAGYISIADTRNDKLEGLMLDNVEALANGEGNGAYDCLGSGTVDCHGHYVKYMIEGYSIDLE